MGGVFFFNDTATTEIYTLSLHDALPIFAGDVADVRIADAEAADELAGVVGGVEGVDAEDRSALGDRKSTRLNSSHANISYAVFCLKKNNIPCATLTDASPSFVLYANN